MARQILIWNEDDWYIAKDIITNVASQGKTRDEARNNLREALELYFDDNIDTEDQISEYHIETLEVM